MKQFSSSRVLKSNSVKRYFLFLNFDYIIYFHFLLQLNFNKTHSLLNTATDTKNSNTVKKIHFWLYKRNTKGIFIYIDLLVFSFWGQNCVFKENPSTASTHYG